MTWDFDAGHLVLDFVNTLEWRNSSNPHESLYSFEDFIEWAHQGGVLSESDIETIATENKGTSDGTKSSLAHMLGFRERLYRIFSSASAGLSPTIEDLENLNESISMSRSHTKLEWDGDKFNWGWRPESNLVERLLWVITQDAVDLLTSDLLIRVGECADDRGCGYLFVDTSKNRSRKWCSMEACGNRAKARKHYQRKKLDDSDD
jgi:predicted RNA-binding Zn ribbon-like protein